MSQYARQIVLSEVGEAGQKKLASARVLVVGAGGLGCPALQYLCAAGVGHIGIIDHDKVELSNLHRQILFDVSQIGLPKVEAARVKLSQLNPDVLVSTYNERLSAHNVEEFFQSYDLIIDGTDNFDAKYLINDAACKYGKPFIFGAINQYEGQVALFDLSQGGACYRCLYPHPPKEHVPNCAEAGVLGAVAGQVGTLQAIEAIKYILDHENFETLSGRFFSIDMKTMRMRVLSISQDEQCPVCTKAPQDVQLTVPKEENEIMMVYQTAQDVKDIDAVFIDVREQDEWDAGHIEGAVFAPLSEMLEGRYPEFPKDKTLVVYCRSGQRSQSAISILHAKGYQDCINMSDGYLGWTAQT